MTLSDMEKDRLTEWYRRLIRRMDAGADEAFPGIPPITDEELRAAWRSLTPEEAAYVDALVASRRAYVEERLELLEERVPRHPPADDPVLRRIDEQGIADPRTEPLE